jgi:signal transduction histidine kinase
MGVIAGANLAHFFYFENLKQTDDYTLRVMTKQMSLVKDMEFAAMEITEGKDDYRGILQEKGKEYDSVLQAFINGSVINGNRITVPTEEIRAYLAANKQLWDEYKQKINLLVTSEYSNEEFHQEDGVEEQHSEHDNPELREAFTYIDEKSEELIAVNDLISMSYLGLANSKWQSANQATATFVAINIVIFGLAFLFIRKIIFPIKTLTATIDNIKSGQYETKAEIKSDDEIGTLAKNFNAMIDVIQTRTKELELKNKISERVNAHVSELARRESEANEHLQSLTAQLKEQAEKLRDVDLAKEEFSSMITHELKTPLVPIQGYCELLLDGTLGNITQEQREKIQIIYDSALSLSQLIQDVLDVHKLELGKMKFDMRDISAKELIERSIKRFDPIAASKKIDLVDGTDQELKLKCDPERILQVINNLVGNAVKFVPEKKGRIEICARRNDGSVLFTVKDNGIGISKEKQQNLFKKFYQVDASFRRNSGGSGLGLAICKGIVEAHNGRIWLEGDTGKGSTFYFSIPIGGQNQ